MTYQPRFKQKVLGNFIHGKFVFPVDPEGELALKSPAHFGDKIGTFLFSYDHVDQAVDSARESFKKWKKSTVEERAEYLRKYREALESRQDELSEVIAREVGKPLWEAKTELKAMIGKVDITINESLEYVRSLEIKEILPETLGRCEYRPYGVIAVIGPFNFPGHLPNGHIVPALLTGNTVIFKPSEKTPLIGQLMAECMQQAGLPPGVFQLIHGEKEVGRRLCVHEQVDGVFFTGSYEVGTRIKQDTLQQHWKILALEMGGKNSAIVWEDADIDVAVRETLFGAFVTTGQRCSATSRILVHQKVYSSFIEKLHEKSKSFKIGHPFEESFMGPLIDQTSVDRYLKFQGIASREGCEVLMRGKALQLKQKGFYVSPSICLVKDASVEHARKSVYQQTEIFGPNVAVIPVEDIESAIDHANVTQYGLASSVFTESETIFHQISEELQFGLVNWNRATVGASSRLPFGGLKKSGNHRPTALTASLYCVHPLSVLETKKPKKSGVNYPGIRFDS